MRIATLIVAVFSTMGCAPVLGTHIHRFSRKGVDYVACHVVVDEKQPQLGVDALKICQDAISHEPVHK
jgi:hypothetical protein